MMPVDGETIGTSSFFPSFTRQLTPDVPFESVSSTNVVEQLPGFLTDGAHTTPTAPRAESSTQSDAPPRAEASAQNNPY